MRHILVGDGCSPANLQTMMSSDLSCANAAQAWSSASTFRMPVTAAWFRCTCLSLLFTLGCGSTENSDASAPSDDTTPAESPASTPDADSSLEDPGEPTELIEPDDVAAGPVDSPAPSPAPNALCDRLTYELEAPTAPIDYLVVVNLDRSDEQGLSQAEALLGRIVDRLAEPNNNDFLHVYWPALLAEPERLEENPLRINFTQLPTAAVDSEELEHVLRPATISYRPVQPRLDASLQVVSFRKKETDDSFCATTDQPCVSTADRRAIAATLLDETAGAGWQLHVVQASGACDAASSSAAPLVEALATESGGQIVDYCVDSALDSFLSEVDAALSLPLDECQLALPDLVGTRAFGSTQLNVSAVGPEGDTSMPLVEGGAGCDGYTLNRAINPTAVTLCPEFCSAPAERRTLSVEIGCEAACERLSTGAKLREASLDLVVGIDSSGSMREEQELVEENLGRFLEILEASGIDIRVILLAGRQFPVPADVRVLSLPLAIDSITGWDVMIDRFDEYGGYLRAGVPAQYLLITDDDTRIHPSPSLPGMPPSPEEFVGQMEALLNSPFIYHSISSPGDSFQPCEGDHGAAARAGMAQLEAVDLTGGTQLSICTPDWAPLFDTFAEALLETVPASCEFELPPAPGDAAYSTSGTDVQFAGLDDPTVYTVPATISAETCGADGGWYFDDRSEPTSVHFCDNTCEAVARSKLPALTIALGCEIDQPIPPDLR